MAKKPTGADHGAPLTVEDEPGMAERFQRGLQRALNTPPQPRTKGAPKRAAQPRKKIRKESPAQ